MATLIGASHLKKRFKHLPPEIVELGIMFCDAKRNRHYMDILMEFAAVLLGTNDAPRTIK